MAEFIDLVDDDNEGQFDERCFIHIDHDDDDDDDDEEEPGPEFLDLTCEVMKENQNNHEMTKEQRHALHESVLAAEDRFGCKVLEISRVGEMQRQWAISCHHEIFTPTVAPKERPACSTNADRFHCFRCGLECLTTTNWSNSKLDQSARVDQLIDQLTH